MSFTFIILETRQPMNYLLNIIVDPTNDNINTAPIILFFAVSESTSQIIFFFTLFFSVLEKKYFLLSYPF